jgi:hypothetical protein
MDKLKQLDKKAEITMLLPHEIGIKHCLNVRLIQLLREEEIRRYQRSKSNKLRQGDSNKKYFHMVANGRNRKSRIFQLMEGDRTLRTITKICLVLQMVDNFPSIVIDDQIYYKFCKTIMKSL